VPERLIGGVPVRAALAQIDASGVIRLKA